MSGSEYQSSHDLSRWHDGDVEALHRLVEKHAPWIRERLRRRMTKVHRQRGETMDYVHDGILEFLLYAPRFQIASEGKFRRLLLVIAENCMLEQYRRWRAQRRDIARERPMPRDSVLNLESPQPGPQTKAIQNESAGLVRFALEFLRPADRDIIWMQFFERLKIREIATKIGKTEAAARMQRLRAMDRLNKIVKRLEAGRLDELLPRDSADDSDEELGPKERSISA